MLKKLQISYISNKNCIVSKNNYLNYWRKFKKRIKTQYFRIYTRKIWKRYVTFILIRPYLVDKNLWYSAKKNFLKNYNFNNNKVYLIKKKCLSTILNVCKK